MTLLSRTRWTGCAFAAGAILAASYVEHFAVHADCGSDGRDTASAGVPTPADLRDGLPPCLLPLMWEEMVYHLSRKKTKPSRIRAPTAWTG